jgi:dienelactone hydrolase
MEIRAVKFRVGREWRVGGLYYPSAASAPAPAVLMLHGFPGILKNEDVAAELVRRGMSAFVPHARGSWGSPGPWSVEALFSDSRAALRLLARYPFVDPARLGVLGYSLGGWAALKLASERRVAAVAALAPAVPDRAFPGDPRYVRRSARVLDMPRPESAWTQYLALAALDRPELYMPRISPAPLLLVQGGRDAMVAPASTRRLWSLAMEPKTLLELPSEEHELYDDRRAVVRAVCGWLEARLLGAPVRRRAPSRQRASRS